MLGQKLRNYFLVLFFVKFKTPQFPCEISRPLAVSSILAFFDSSRFMARDLEPLWYLQLATLAYKKHSFYFQKNLHPKSLVYLLPTYWHDDGHCKSLLLELIWLYNPNEQVAIFISVIVNHPCKVHSIQNYSYFLPKLSKKPPKFPTFLFSSRIPRTS